MIEYARSKNPDTIFFVALPWLGRPLDYVGETGDPQTSGHEAYRARILESESGILPPSMSYETPLRIRDLPARLRSGLGGATYALQHRQPARR